MADTDDKDKVKLTWRDWGAMLLLLAACVIVGVIFWLLSDYILLAILFLPMVVMVVLGALNVKI